MAVYRISNHTFMVDRIVFSRQLDGLKGDRLRLYLYMCKVTGIKSPGIYFKSFQEANKDLNTTEWKYRKALQWLLDHYFIKKEAYKKVRANVYRVLYLPLYDGQNYYSRDGIKRDRTTFKSVGSGYVEMPIEILDSGVLSNHSEWTDLRIHTLGILYLYFWIDVYGGIDPNIISINSSGQIHVDSSLIVDLKTTKNRIINNLSFFEKQGLLTKVTCVYRLNPNAAEYELQYIGDLGKVAKRSGDRLITLYRFTVIPSTKLSNAQNRTKGGVDI